MQIVHILRNDFDPVMRFKPGDGEMSGVRSYFLKLPSALVIEIQDQFGIPGKALRGGYLHHVMPFPEPSGIPKGTDTAFGTHSGSAKYNQSLHRV